MRLNEIYLNNNPVLSYEIYPPKNGLEDLKKELNILKKYNPAFISLTYGAGGNENKSFELIKQLQKDFDVMPHFTCITSSKESVGKHLKEIESLNIDKILALRGDIPEDKNLMCHDFCYANELVSFIKQKTNLSIGVGGYPEGHIESLNLKSDIDNLKRKADAGADVIFTQLFFDNNKFYDFCERVKNAGINIPVIPGIMPIISKKQIEKMTSLAKITLTDEVRTAIEKYDSLKDFGIDYATRQCEALIKFGVKGLHFYTLNKAYSTAKILDNIRR